MKDRAIKISRRYAILLAVGLLYLAWVLLTDIRIPCVLYLLTGLECPGCGVTRMLSALARLDLAAAFEYNAFLLLTSPVILFCIVYPDVRYVRHGEYTLGAFGFLPWVEIVLALVFAVVRNLV